MAKDLAELAKDAIAEMRPYLEKSGASVELLGVEDGIAHVSVGYGRTGYLLSSLAFAAGIERALREKVPNLRGVVPVNLPPYSGVGWDEPRFLAHETALDPSRSR